jgi:hypothetical protein
MLFTKHKKDFEKFATSLPYFEVPICKLDKHSFKEAFCIVANKNSCPEFRSERQFNATPHLD